MPRKHIAMFMSHRPDQPEEKIIFSFPAKQYPLDRVYSLFMRECERHILAQRRQASDVQLITDDCEPGTLIRCVARLGGMDRLDFELSETHDYGASGSMPENLEQYRGPESFRKCPWDIVYHGEAWPSEPEKYAAGLGAFFRSDFKQRHDEL